MPRSGPRRRVYDARRKEVAEYVMKRPVIQAHISSAALQKIKTLQTAIAMPEGWQRDAYGYYETIGELAEVLNETASAVARCDLRPIVSSNESVPNGYKQTDDERVMRVWNAFKGPRGGLGELVRKAALNLQIAGEAILTGIPIQDRSGAPAGLSWEFLSGDEIRVENNGNTVKRNYGYAGIPPLELPVETYIARLWRSDPRFSERADCAVKHVLPICQEIILMTQVFDAVAKSRLSAGILFVPDEMSFGPFEETEDDSDETDEIDPFSQELMEQLTAPVEDRSSAASLVPLIMRGPAEFYDKVSVIQLARDLDHMYQDLRLEAIKRLATGLDVPIEIMFGKGGLNHWCTDTETTILTQDRGWITQDQLSIGDVVLTLNHDSGFSEWQPVQDIYRAQVENLEMVSIEGDRHSSLTTLNHRWPVLKKVRENLRDPETGKMTTRAVGTKRVWTTSEKLNSNDALIMAAPCIDLPVEVKWNDALVELVAWFWTEGQWRERSDCNWHQVTIWQSQKVNPENVVSIRRALTSLFGTGVNRFEIGSPIPAWREHVRPDRPEMVEFKLNQAAEYVLEDIAPNRVVSLDFIHQLTQSQLELFISISVRADGTVLPAGTIHLAQRSAERLEALRLAAILTGRSVTVYPWRTGTPRVDMTMLSMSNQQNLNSVRKPMVSRETYTGIVWCPVTSNGSWMAKRGNSHYFTGNTGYNIDSDFITKHIMPIGDMIAEFLTSAFLVPMLVEFEDMTEEEASTFRLYFDSAKITSRTDAGPSARAAFDRKALSEVAYIRESGLAESDMPTLDERRERDLRGLMEAEPMIFGPQIIGMLYPELKDKIIVPVTQMNPGPNPAAPSGRPADEPTRRNDPSGPDSDPVIDNETGQDEPIPRGPAGPRMDESLIDRLAMAGDGALEQALEEAGNRLLAEMNGAHAELKARLRDLPRTQIPSALSQREFVDLGVTPGDLFGGAFDLMVERGQGWLREFYLSEGHSASVADERAALVMTTYVDILQSHLHSVLERPLRVAPNGLRVPNEFVAIALEQAERII